MELRHLRYFTAVVESGSFTAAAAALHISQPPLSVAIAKLEAEAGVQLLQRSHRGVEPTSAGRYLLDAASRVLAEVDDMVEMLSRFGSGMAGALRLAVVPVLMWHRLPRVLRVFAEAAPQVEISIVDPPPWTAVEMLERGAVDVAAIMVAEPERFIARHQGAYDILEWGQIPLVGVLPPGTGASTPLALSWFEGKEIVLPHRTAAVPSLPEAVEVALRSQGVHPFSMRTSETIQTCLPLIEAGLATAILPDPDRASLAKFDVEIRELHPAPVPLTALALTRKGAAGANSAVDRFLRTLATERTSETDQP